MDKETLLFLEDPFLRSLFLIVSCWSSPLPLHPLFLQPFHILVAYLVSDSSTICCLRGGGTLNVFSVLSSNSQTKQLAFPCACNDGSC